MEKDIEHIHINDYIKLIRSKNDVSVYLDDVKLTIPVVINYDRIYHISSTLQDDIIFVVFKSHSDIDTIYRIDKSTGEYSSFWYYTGINKILNINDTFIELYNTIFDCHILVKYTVIDKLIAYTEIAKGESITIDVNKATVISNNIKTMYDINGKVLV